MRRQTAATLYALSAVLLWSTVASAFKLSLRTLSITELLFFASLASILAQGAIVVLSGQLATLSRVTRRDLAFSAFLGLLNPFGFYLVLFKAYDLLPAQEAQPLNFTWAITLSLLSVPLLKQPLKLVDLLALLISYTGVYVIATRGDVTALSFSSPLGVALALGSTVIWALYWIANTKDPLQPACRLVLNFAFGTLYIGLLLGVTGISLPKPAGLVGAAYVGFFEMGFTFILWSQALKLSRSASQVSIFIYLAPFLSLVFIHFLVGEAILPSTLVGLVFITAGIGLQQFVKAREATLKPSKS
jgi:drug/metabolite transporter (DMT)-like permease